MILERVKNIILDILFPAACLTCSTLLPSGEKNNVVCGACIQSIPLYDALSCPVCLRRVPPQNRVNAHAKTCHPHASYLLASATNYSHEKVRQLIRQFKYEHWLTAAEPAGALITAYLRRLPQKWDDYAIVPIPLHPAREFKRGFNQAAVLASAIGAALCLPVIKNNVTRVKNTLSQTEQKNYHEREKNMQNAFHIARPEEFKKKNIMLVDDVCTSGATLAEAARTLKISGAGHIIAAVVARAR